MIGIGMFRKEYWIRSFKEQTIVRGHVSHGYEDHKTMLNVQPLSPDEIAALPEGQRDTRRIKAYGSEVLNVTNVDAGIVGDRLYYYGRWYECISSTIWDHTVLAHCESQFVQCSINEGNGSLDPPNGGSTP